MTVATMQMAEKKVWAKRPRVGLKFAPCIAALLSANELSIYK